jgi:hypothetical protein
MNFQTATGPGYIATAYNWENGTFRQDFFSSLSDADRFNAEHAVGQSSLESVLPGEKYFIQTEGAFDVSAEHEVLRNWMAVNGGVSGND